MANEEIRAEIEKKRLKYYEVAEKIGICPETFSKWLRKELKPSKKSRVRHAIWDLEEELKNK